jgi:Flp pilus assembly protein TadD
VVGWLALILVVGTAALFWPATRNEFVNLDDPDYYTVNPVVQAGLTAAGFRWAFQAGAAGNWHPLTWLSHQLDAELFGLRPAGPHAVNVAWHALNAALLLLVLVQFTGHRGRSFLVALLFAVHPLHVESVAWISERKDVLSAAFGLLTLLAYAAYVRPVTRAHPSAGLPVADPARTDAARPSPLDFAWLRSRWYWLALGCFALGLMSKPMLVTWPFLLLLLDVWPLRRLSSVVRCPWSAPGLTPADSLRGNSLSPPERGEGWGEGEAPSERQCCAEFNSNSSSQPCYPLGEEREKQPELRRSPWHASSQWSAPSGVPSSVRALLLEKVPFFLLAGISVWLTVIAQHRGGAVQTLADTSLAPRLANAVVSYARYLGKTFWPVDLAVPYPHPGAWPMAIVLSSLLVLGMITVLAWRARRRCPALLIGWLWFLGTLVPVIGLVQVGSQSMADRYFYLPGIGLLVALVWGVADFLPRPAPRAAAGPASSPASSAPLPQSPGPWSVVRGLWSAIARPSSSPSGASSFGIALLLAALAVAALAWLTHRQIPVWRNSETLFTHAVRVTRGNYIAHYNLGHYYQSLRRFDDAFLHYTRTTEYRPQHPDAWNNLGVLLTDQRRYADALPYFRSALKHKPAEAEFRANVVRCLLIVGKDLARRGQPAAALPLFREAVELAPADDETQNALGSALALTGDPAAALPHFRAAVELRPDSVSAQLNLGRALTALGETNAAAPHFERAQELQRRAPRPPP